MKLHLGCGETYLKGYVNIDYPPSLHPTKFKNVADEYHDITKLRYPRESVDEVRLHHVFEHFPRAVACALLASWWSWLKPGGLLRIEVPDFDRTALRVLSPFSSEKSKFVALRHIFGSQHELWAVHFEGWSAKRLSRVLADFGFEVEMVKNKKMSGGGLHNVEVSARKIGIPLTAVDFERKAREILSLYRVDESKTEQKILEVWMKVYREQIKISWSADQ